MASEQDRTKPPPGYRIAPGHPDSEAAIAEAWDHWDRYSSPAAKLAEVIRERDDLRVELRVAQGQREAAKGALAEARQERDEARRLCTLAETAETRLRNAETRARFLEEVAEAAERQRDEAKEHGRRCQEAMVRARDERDAERERSRRLVEALLDAFPGDEDDWAGAALRRVLAGHAEPRPAEPWKRKPVTHEWAKGSLDTDYIRTYGPGGYRHVRDLLMNGWTIHPWAPRVGFPATRPVRGEP